MKIGIIGDGQLGWMTIFENRKLNFNFFVLGKDPKAPASKIADRFFHYEDIDTFLNAVDEVVFEFEHIPDFVMEKVSERFNTKALRIKRSRISEKSFLKEKGYPLGRFEFSQTKQLKEKIKDFTLPVVIKAEKLGYDGKGQYIIRNFDDLEDIYRNHGEDEGFIIEEFIDFKYEVSAIGVKGKNGEKRIYPVSFNYHKDSILLYNYAPFKKYPDIEDIIFSLLDDLEITGVLAVEFFVTKEEKILINEFAPRPHNTGHWTMDGSFTSQFENVVRAVSGLPLGSTDTKINTGMVNILGKDLKDFSVNEILSINGTQLYWYGKEKREKRKMGHINIMEMKENLLKEKIEKIINLIYD